MYAVITNAAIASSALLSIQNDVNKFHTNRRFMNPITTTITTCSTPQSSKFRPTFKVNKNNDRWNVAEKMNARLAMLGYVCGSITEYTSGENYIEQFKENYLLVLATTLLIGYSTLITKDVAVNNEEKPFTSNIELLNGRMVMMGVLFKFIYDGSVYFQ
jgi:hypothetical protein